MAAPAGTPTEPAGPIAAMRFPVTRMSARGMTSSPFMVMARAFRRTTEPLGRGRGTVRVIGIASGLGASGSAALPPSVLASAGFFSASFFLSASAFFSAASRTRSRLWR